MSLLALAAAAATWGVAFWLPGGAPDLLRVAAIVLAAGFTLLMPVGAMRDVSGEASGGGVVGRGIALLFVGVHVLGWLVAWEYLQTGVEEFIDDPRRDPIPVLANFLLWAPGAFAALAAASSLILALASLQWLVRRR